MKNIFNKVDIVDLVYFFGLVGLFVKYIVEWYCFGKCINILYCS